MFVPICKGIRAFVATCAELKRFLQNSDRIPKQIPNHWNFKNYLHSDIRFESGAKICWEKYSFYAELPKNKVFMGRFH